MKKLIIFLLISSSLSAAQVDTQLSYGDTKSGIGDLTNYEISPLSRYLNKEQYKEIIENPSSDYSKDNKGMFKKVRRVQGNVLTVDTRDQEACEKVQKRLTTSFPTNNYKELCIQDDEKPFNSVIALSDGRTEYRTYIEDVMPDLDPKYSELAKQTKSLAALGVMTVGLIFALPEDVSNWDREDMKHLGQNWKENVKEGPVVDKDEWMINYIGHPLSGAAYHIVARTSGLSAWQSFGYSVFMSTFFWEYGLEAFAEVPSIQDLILTPVLGSLMGEMFYKAISSIEDNGGKLWGSKRMGTFAKNAMNPSEPLRNWVNRRVFDQEFIKNSRTYFYMRGSRFDGQTSSQQQSIDYIGDSEIGIGMEFKF